MQLKQVVELFEFAHLQIDQVKRIPNGYFPEPYVKEREASPWWEVTTPYGMITIGWRKRVISINWETTVIRGIITHDDVTKGDDHVHAYGYGKAIEYLSNFVMIPRPKPEVAV